MTITSSLRQFFPIFDKSNSDPDWVYFDSAATSQKPLQVLDSISTFYRSENANVHRASHRLASQTTGKFEQARANVQRFINARNPSEIIWTKGATESINLVASGLKQSCFKAGDRILLTDTEHHANIVPWLEAAKQCKLEIDVIPIDENGVLDIEKGLDLIGPDTALLAIGHVSNALGNINPLLPLLAKAKSHHALTLIDGCQATAHLSIDVQALDCDFYVFSGHKMFGPTGIGVLYGKSTLLKKLPPYQTGGEMIDKVSFDQVSYQQPPFKFEAGTPNISGVLGLDSAVNFVRDNRQSIMSIESHLYQYLLSELSSVEGVKLYGDLKNTISTQSFQVQGINNQDLGLLLNEQNIAVRVGHHCAMPLMQALNVDGTIRVSLACYNDDRDIDRFIVALKQAIEKLQQGGSTLTEMSTAVQASLSELALGQKVKSARGWDNIYRQIMLAGKQQRNLPPEQRISDNEVFGCESQVWLSIIFDQGRFSASYFSASKIVRGLLAIMLEPIQGNDVEEVLKYDYQAYFASLGLDKHLSESRGNGLNAVMDKIRNVTTTHLQTKKSD